MENTNVPISASLIKAMNTDDKIFWLRKEIQKADNPSYELAVNVINFLRKGCAFNTEFFSNPVVYVNSMEEFSKILSSLRQDLKEFIAKLLGVYYSCIKNVGNITEADNPISVPALIKNVLFGIDFMTLSRLNQKIEPLKDTNMYQETFQVIAGLSNKMNLLEAIVNSSSILDNSVKKEVKKATVKKVATKKAPSKKGGKTCCKKKVKNGSK